MNRRLMPRPLLYGLHCLVYCLALTACETEKIQQTKLGIQQNLFLQSLELVESAGTLLQKPGLEAAEIEAAMLQMDQGLKQAFQVDSVFLKRLDPRLPKLYTTTFISGVENYRIGVEASDRSKQLEGLDLLRQWSLFWQEEKPAILGKMAKLTGLPAGPS